MWTTPADWDYKEAPGSAKLNQQIRDNMNYLKLSLPAGIGPLPWAASTAPDQWILCDGSDVSRSTYAALFTAIGTTYGAGDGTTTFNLPNCKGKVLVGKNSAETEFDTLGETGGAKTHTLIEAEMPSHTHIQTQHRHTMEMDYSDSNGPYTQGSAGTTNGPINTNYATPTNQNTGGGGAHNNLQPYLVINYIIKY
jgi:microcystin-dependent protein